MIDADYTGSAKERNKNLQTQFALEYNIPYVKGLKVKGTFIYDYNNWFSNSFFKLILSRRKSNRCKEESPLSNTV